MVLLPTIVLGEEFRTLELENKTIDFYTLIPLYSEEVDLKLKEGVDVLFNGFDRFSITDVVKINRIIVTKRTKPFGCF